LIEFTLGGVGWNWVLLGARGQSHGQSEKLLQSNILCFPAGFPMAQASIDYQNRKMAQIDYRAGFVI
jgi:hypothetical protein